MFCKQDDPIGSGKAAVLQAELNTVLEFMGITPLLVVDDDYGQKTAKALLDTGCGNAANAGSVYWVGEYTALNAKLRDIAAARALATHNADMQHGGELPETVLMQLPETTVTTVVPAQTVTAHINP